MEIIPEDPEETASVQPEVLAAVPTASRRPNDKHTAAPGQTVEQTDVLSAQTTEQPIAAAAEKPPETVTEQPTKTVAEQSAGAPAEQLAEAHAEQPTEIPAEQPTEDPIEQPAEDPVTTIPSYPNASGVRWYWNPCPRFLKYVALKRVLSNRPLNHPVTSATLVTDLALGLLPTSHFCSLDFWES